MTRTDQIPALSQTLDGPWVHGFVTDIEARVLSPYLDEQTMLTAWQEQIRKRIILISNVARLRQAA